MRRRGEPGGTPMVRSLHRGPGPGGAVAYWGVGDIHAALAQLATLGASIRDPVQDVGGNIKVAVVADPFGNWFGVIENPHFDPQKVM